MLGGLRALRDDGAAGLPDRLGAGQAVVAHARQHHGHRALADRAGEGGQQRVEHAAGTGAGGRGQRQRSVRQQLHHRPRRAHGHGAGPQRIAVDGPLDAQRQPAAQDVGQLPTVSAHVLGDHHGESEIGGQRAQHGGDRPEPARGRDQRDDRRSGVPRRAGDFERG